MAPRRCKECPTYPPYRPAPYTGPRCATHHRARKAALREQAHERRLLATYNLTLAEYQWIYKAQGERCAICQRATGRIKRLAVDHDHSCCPGPVSCGKCVRGLLCGTCNKMLGHLRDDPDAFVRASLYLMAPPAKKRKV